MRSSLERVFTAPVALLSLAATAFLVKSLHRCLHGSVRRCSEGRFANKMSKVGFAENYEVIKALMSYGLDEAHGMRITVGALQG